MAKNKGGSIIILRGARSRIRKYFEDNVGKIVTTKQIKKIANISEYARRIRELRDDEGMQIQSFRDDPELKPDQYRLISLKRLPRLSHKIDKATRARILERNGLSCAMCGATAGDIDPYNANRRITLQVDHIDPDGPTTDNNLRTLCNNCNEGRSNIIIPPTPKTLSVLRLIRRLGRDDQMRIYNELKTKYEGYKNE